MKNKKRQITGIKFLRAFASLSVCWFHLTNGNINFLDDGFLKDSGKYGWVGVEIFFVISGFILPYALVRSNYKLKNYGKFILKRLARLEPPFILTIIVVILLNYISSLMPFYKGQSFFIDFTGLVLHFGYLNAFFNYQWVNPVFWTLAIEFQYYIIIGLVTPLLFFRKNISLILFIIICSLSFYFQKDSHIGYWINLFVLGFISTQYYCEVISRKRYLFCLSLIVVIILFKYGTVQTIASLFAIFCIFFINTNNFIIGFFANISYSLYLIHIPIGGRIINLATRFDDNLITKILFLSLALFISIIASYLLYRYVEKPSKEIASKIIYT